MRWHFSRQRWELLDVCVVLSYRIVMSQHKWNLLCIEINSCFCYQGPDFRQWGLSAQHFIEVESELGNKCILVPVHPSMKCRWPNFRCRHKAKLFGLKYIKYTEKYWKLCQGQNMQFHHCSIFLEMYWTVIFSIRPNTNIRIFSVAEYKYKYLIVTSHLIIEP